MAEDSCHDVGLDGRSEGIARAEIIVEGRCVLTLNAVVLASHHRTGVRGRVLLAAMRIICVGRS